MAAEPPGGEPRLEVLRARLEPAGRSIESRDILVLNTPAGSGDAARTRELCRALFRPAPQVLVEHPLIPPVLVWHL
jgi:hypothetical protein